MDASEAIGAPTQGSLVVPGSQSWLRLARLAKLLSSLTLVWLGIEGAIGVVAGIIAGSIALVAFGLDSAIEASPASSSSGGSRERGQSRRPQSDAPSGGWRSASSCLPHTWLPRRPRR